MASKQTEELLIKIQGMLEKQGITDYVIALKDPDSPVDCLHVFGSAWWRVGLATEMIEDYKYDRKLEWDAALNNEEDEDNDNP